MQFELSKIDAAVDQLDWSIRLFLDHQAYVPAITLAAAAEVRMVQCERQGGRACLRNDRRRRDARCRVLQTGGHASVNSAGDDRAEEPEDRQPDEDGYDLFDGCAHPPSCLKSADRQAGLLREQSQEGGLLGLGRQSAANVYDAKRRSCDFLQISRGPAPSIMLPEWF